jgi:glycosyltransferase involved in cell wall biosynthesis
MESKPGLAALEGLSWFVGHVAPAAVTPSTRHNATLDGVPKTDSPEPSSLTCSVVVPTRRRAGLLADCLAALRVQHTAPLEILVVDNSSGDAATRAAADHAGARYIHVPNGALCAARNVGARAARGDVVAYVDDDAVAEPEWIAALLTGFTDSAVGAVTGRIRPTIVESDAHRAAVAAGISMFDQDTPITLDRSMPDWFARAAFGGVGNGGNMAIRRALFDAGFAFHERTGRGTAVIAYDEHFAFLDLVTRGYRVVYVPTAVVRHPLPGTIDDLRRQQARDVAAFSAYVTLLFIETPHRVALSRFLWQALRRTRRSWRTYSATPAPRLVSRAKMALALASGPFRYLRGLTGG